MNRPEPCEFCGRRPLSPGGKKLRAHLQAIWDAPTPWEIERAKEAEKAKAKAGETMVVVQDEPQPKQDRHKGRAASI